MFLFFPLSLSLFVQRLSTICTHCFNFFLQSSALHGQECLRQIYEMFVEQIIKNPLYQLGDALEDCTASALEQGRKSLKIHENSLCEEHLQKSPTFRFLFDIFLHQACFQNWRLCYLIIFHFPKKCMLFFWFSQLRQLFVFWLFTPCFFPSLSPILDGLLGTPQVFRSKLHSFLMILGFRDGWWM